MENIEVKDPFDYNVQAVEDLWNSLNSVGEESCR